MLRAVLLASLLVPGPALAADAARSCFPMHQFQGWRAPDARTVYIRVGQTRVFRLDLSASCQALTFPGSHLVTQTRGSDQMCSGLDWDLAVSRDTPGSIPEHCIVKTQTELTKAEADAIPKEFQPH